MNEVVSKTAYESALLALASLRKACYEKLPVGFYAMLDRELDEADRIIGNPAQSKKLT